MHARLCLTILYWNSQAPCLCVLPHARRQAPGPARTPLCGLPQAAPSRSSADLLPCPHGNIPARHDLRRQSRHHCEIHATEGWRAAYTYRGAIVRKPRSMYGPTGPRASDPMGSAHTENGELHTNENPRPSVIHRRRDVFSVISVVESVSPYQWSSESVRKYLSTSSRNSSGASSSSGGRYSRSRRMRSTFAIMPSPTIW